jgi:serine/threonine protein kinase
MIWKKGEVLGIGSFGKVFSGISVSSGMKMAIKEVYVLKSKNSKQQVKAFQEKLVF